MVVAAAAAGKQVSAPGAPLQGLGSTGVQALLTELLRVVDVPKEDSAVVASRGHLAALEGQAANLMPVSHQFHDHRLLQPQVVVSDGAVLGAGQQSPVKAVLDTAQPGGVGGERAHLDQLAEVDHVELAVGVAQIEQRAVAVEPDAGEGVAGEVAAAEGDPADGLVVVEVAVAADADPDDAPCRPVQALSVVVVCDVGRVDDLVGLRPADQVEVKLLLLEQLHVAGVGGLEGGGAAGRGLGLLLAEGEAAAVLLLDEPGVGRVGVERAGAGRVGGGGEVVEGGGLADGHVAVRQQGIAPRVHNYSYRDLTMPLATSIDSPATRQPAKIININPQARRRIFSKQSFAQEPATGARCLGALKSRMAGLNVQFFTSFYWFIRCPMFSFNLRFSRVFDCRSQKLIFIQPSAISRVSFRVGSRHFSFNCC